MPNIEIKARTRSLTQAREIAERVQTHYLGKLHQIDTYFETKKGRLKLREIDQQSFQLIPYEKDYSSGPMQSDYAVIELNDADLVKNLLDRTLGTIAIVDKRREVFLADNIRIHLDQVQDLGDFVEFEAVYDDRIQGQKEREVEKVNALMDTFQIQAEDLLDRSYIDYLLDLK
jgi:adenylate cyclase class IV